MGYCPVLGDLMEYDRACEEQLANEARRDEQLQEMLDDVHIKKLIAEGTATEKALVEFFAHWVKQYRAIDDLPCGGDYEEFSKQWRSDTGVCDVD